MEVSEYFKRNKDSKEKNSLNNKETTSSNMKDEVRSWNTTDKKKWQDRDSKDNKSKDNRYKDSKYKDRGSRDNRDNNVRESRKDRRDGGAVDVWRPSHSKESNDRNDNKNRNDNRNGKDRNDRGRNDNRSGRNDRGRNRSHDKSKKHNPKYANIIKFNPNKPISSDSDSPAEILVTTTTTEQSPSKDAVSSSSIKTSGNGWKPKRIDTTTVEGKIEQNVRTAQGFLNKMTDVTFDSLSDKFVEVAVTENGNPPLPGQLKLLIDRIFEQALKQPVFCPMYASLCDKIHNKMATFRRVLLTKCQEEFERGSKQPPSDLPAAEIDVFVFKAKKRMLGNIKFIGELYKNNVIVVPVMYECFNHLLKDQTVENSDEEQIEALCRLLINTGSTIDPNTDNNRISECVDHMVSIKDGVSSRIRFLIDDVVDIRNNNWKDVR